MSNSSENDPLITVGVFVFIITAGFTALELGGFGFGLDLDLKTCVIIATVGGAIGGLLMARSCRWAGAIGGAIAGPCGLLALAWYVSGRQQVWNVELVLVQMVASLPGLGVYYLLKLLTAVPPADEEPLDVEEA